MRRRSTLRRRYGHMSHSGLAREVAMWLEGVGRHATPHQISQRWGVDIRTADRLYYVPTSAFGPGGKGVAWAAREVERIL